MKLNIEINSNDPNILLDFNDPDLQEYLPILARKTAILNDCKNNKELLILRGHIAIEYFLGNIIEKYLPNGKKLNGENLNFSKKLLIVESFEVLELDVVILIKRLNKLRNKCAHKLEYRISESDTDSLGECIPDVYSKISTGENALFDIITSILLSMAYSCYLLTKEKKKSV